VYALEMRVHLPLVDLPGFTAGEVCPGVVGADLVQAARALRQACGLGQGPVPRMVRLLEAHGVIVTLVPFAGAATGTVDAFSTSQLHRPIVVLTPDRARRFRELVTSVRHSGPTVPGGAVTVTMAPGDKDTFGWK
jgi:hypothetical protein